MKRFVLLLCMTYVLFLVAGKSSFASSAPLGDVNDDPDFCYTGWSCTTAGDGWTTCCCAGVCSDSVII